MYLPAGLGTLDSHQVPPTHAQLVAEGRFPRVLVGCKCIPFCHHPLLWDKEVSPIDCHETVVVDIPLFLTFKVNLRLRVRRGGGGVRTGLEKEI